VTQKKRRWTMTDLRMEDQVTVSQCETCGEFVIDGCDECEPLLREVGEDGE